MSSPAPTLTKDNLRYWRLRPDARLAHVVRCYFVVEAGLPPSDHRDELLLPDGYAEIVFAFAAGYERRCVGETQPHAVMRESYLIGGRSHSICTSGSPRRLNLVGVKLDPRFLRALIATPLDEFRDTTLSLRDLNHAGLRDLEDAVANSTAIEGTSPTELLTARCAASTVVTEHLLRGDLASV